MNGAKITAKCLINHGVDTVFGYPGASILPLIDAIAREKKLRFVMNTQEEFCAFSADGYARSTGKVGVCIATSGPGATNLVTGIANAYMDSIPLVAITGNVPLALLGTDAFQETDIAGVTMPITKHNFIVKSVSQLESTLTEAFYIASTGRKGPVLVDVPCNIFEEDTKYLDLKKTVSPKDEIIGDLHAASGLLNASKNPFICVGGGAVASGAAEEIAQLVKKLNCPVASTAMGIGAFDGTSGNYCGLVGNNADPQTEELFLQADLFVAIGTRFSDRMIKTVQRNPDCPILQIDIDEAEIDKNLLTLYSLTGDAKRVLQSLLPLVEDRNQEARIFRDNTKKSEETVFSLLNRYFPDAIFSTEVGLHQVGACKGLTVKRAGDFLTSGGLGAMGYGLPAAIGASLGNKSRRVVNIAGDGSFNMNLQELATVALYKLPIVQLVMNNGLLGMIEEWQKERYDGRCVACHTPKIDYCTLASAFGIMSVRATNLKELEIAFADTAKTKAPILIDFVMQEKI